MVYESALLSAGVAVSKDEKYKEFTQYKPTGRLLKMWWAKQKNMKKKAIAAKIAHHTHTSTKRVLKDFEYFRNIFKKNKEMSNQLIEQLDLDKEEVAWLKKP
jgi:replication factor C large subunit